MPILANVRHERFAQELACGSSATSAYAAAGYEGRGGGQSANKLLKNPQVAARVAQLKEEIAAAVVQRSVYDREAAMQEADIAFKLALERNNPGAAVAAVTLKAKLNGLLIERQEIKQSPLDGMSSADLAAFVARLEQVAEVEGIGAMEGSA